MRNVFLVLATLADICTIIASCISAYVLVSMVRNVMITAEYATGPDGMGLLVGLIASGGASIGAILPFHFLASAFHRLFERENALAEARRTADDAALSSGSF
ncbi:MAG: hypothetical protein V4530_06105 [Pseudomonadota bacterium]